MFFFRDNETKTLNRFYNSKNAKAMAIFGRRRIGKTELIKNYVFHVNPDKSIYYQCTCTDYNICLNDFISQIKHYYDKDEILYSLKTFKDVFKYISKTSKKKYAFIIDEFPYLCKNNSDAATEFQWIIDNCLDGTKLILLGSSMSFMKNQINNSESPLYGRFDEIIEVNPFTFNEVLKIFPKFEDAINVYAVTGGIPMYVMYFKEYRNVDLALDSLLFNDNGRLFNESNNILMQELRQISTYVSIIRCIGTSEKDSGAIAKLCHLDHRAVFTYLNTLIDLGILRSVENTFSKKKYDKKYEVKDFFFKFYYSFINPNISLIVSLNSKARNYILDDSYKTYLGRIYEQIIRESLFEYALNRDIPFMPKVVNKWWGNIKKDNSYIESEVDVIAYDAHNVIVGECKYKNKMVGINEYNLLMSKANNINVGDRKIYYLLASKSGFSKDILNLKDNNLILIEKNKVVRRGN